MTGWVSLHRKIIDHPFYAEKRVFSRYEAWLDILMRVNHVDGKVIHNGKIETVLRGSTVWSKSDMGEHWGWSNSKVNQFLLCLENDQMLHSESTTKKTVLTVINYDKYQFFDFEKHNKSITETQQKHTNNNDLIIINNDNKEEDLKPSLETTEELTIEPIEELTIEELTKTFPETTVELTNFLIDLIQINNPKAKIPVNLDRWNDEMEKLERIDKYDPMQIRSVIDWCQRDTFWKSVILSAPKLRNKIGTLILKMQAPKGNGKLSGFERLQQMGREEAEREASGSY